MLTRILGWAALVALAIAALVYASPPTDDDGDDDEAVPVLPRPEPKPKRPDCPDCPRPNPKPRPKPRRPWDTRPLAVAGQTPSEPEPAVDLLAMPESLRLANVSSPPGTGAGCCVFRSIDYASHWQNIPATRGMPEWMVKSGIMGGGWPEKVTKLVEQISKERNQPVPTYWQYEGPNYASVIERVLKTGRLPCVTWGGGHMLCCVHLDGEHCGIFDNNVPHKVYWYSRSEGLRRIGAPSGKGWVLAFGAPPPPPPPRNGMHSLGCSGGSACRCVDCPGRGCLCVADGVGARRRSPWWWPWRSRPCPDCPRPHIRPRPRPRPVPRPRPKVRPRRGVAAASKAPAGVTRWTPPELGERFTRCSGAGSDVMDRAAFEADFTDDSTMLHVTVIGGGPLDLAELRGSYLVQTYEPDNWALGCGFVNAGRQVYFQSRDGRVLFRDPGTLADVALVDAIRRADPAYRPDRDPGPVRPHPVRPVRPVRPIPDRPGPDDDRRPQGASSKLVDWARAQGPMFWLLVAGALAAAWYYRTKEEEKAKAAAAPAAVPPVAPPPQARPVTVAELTELLARQQPPPPPK